MNKPALTTAGYHQMIDADDPLERYPPHTNSPVLGINPHKSYFGLKMIISTYLHPQAYLLQDLKSGNCTGVHVKIFQDMQLPVTNESPAL